VKLDLEYYRECVSTNARLIAVALAFFIPLSNTVTTVLSLLLAIFCVLGMDRTRIKDTLKHPITIAVFVIVGLYLLGALYTIADSTAISQAWRKVGRLLYIPLLIPLFVNPIWRRYVTIAYLAAVVISVIAVFCVGHLVFKDNIFTSLFVAFAVFILAHYTFSFPRYRWLTLPALIFLVYYLLFVSIGRTGQILFFMLYALFCWQRFYADLKSMSGAVLLLAALLSCVVVLPSTFIARQAIAAHEVQHYFRDRNAPVNDSSMGTRITFARNAFELVKQRPIFGWGSGSFAEAYAQRFPESKHNGTYTVNPHNQYLLIWVELGIVGLVSLLFLFFSLAREFWRSKDLDARLGMGLVTAISLGCLVNSWLLDYASMFFFVVFAGVLAGAAKIKHK
jgi:O-antigen ligase